MKNNKGQTLVIFVIFLPILIILFALVVDVSTMYMENNRLNNLNNMVLNYGLDNLTNENIKNELNNLILKNDKDISKIKINIDSDSIDINVSKEINSTFGNVIGIKKYKVVSKYNGVLKENKKVITKG